MIDEPVWRETASALSPRYARPKTEIGWWRGQAIIGRFLIGAHASLRATVCSHLIPTALPRISRNCNWFSRISFRNLHFTGE